jgi:hypothetical protein
MDSASAITIINAINGRLSLSLPPNSCHTYVDLESLTNAILLQLGIERPSVRTDSSTRSPTNIQSNSVPIVIVGQAMRLPGNINTPESFWQALVEKRNDILTETPRNRWDSSHFNGDGPCRITFKKSGFVEVASFDNAFFGISAPEAIYISPDIRLVLETAFEALENANIPLSRIKGTDMGVFVAAGLDQGYSELIFLDQGWNGEFEFAAVMGIF